MPVWAFCIRTIKGQRRPFRNGTGSGRTNVRGAIARYESVVTADSPALVIARSPSEAAVATAWERSRRRVPSWLGRVIDHRSRSRPCSAPHQGGRRFRRPLGLHLPPADSEHTVRATTGQVELAGFEPATFRMQTG